MKEPTILPYEEEMKLSREQFLEYNKEIQAWARYKQTEIAPGYTKFTHEAKVKYWQGMHQQMRWQAESGLNPYAGFKPEWRENLLRFEPDLDELIREAFKRSLSWEWDYQEYLSRVGLPKSPLYTLSEIKAKVEKLELSTKTKPPENKPPWWQQIVDILMSG